MPKYKVVGSYPVYEEYEFEVEADSPEALAEIVRSTTPEGTSLMAAVMAREIEAKRLKPTYSGPVDGYKTEWSAWDEAGELIIDDGWFVPDEALDES